MRWSLRDTQPAIEVWEADKAQDKGLDHGLNHGLDHGLDADSVVRWQVQRDLLNSDRFARDFVVETEEDGRAFLRFGDDALGKRPRPNTRLITRYRIGNGSSGNVGAEAIATLLVPDNALPAAHTAPTVSGRIKSLRNPLPAQGGTEPESIDRVRLDAPQAFRQQQRAVTEKDYAAVAERYPGVQRALATRRWTGSWYTLFITVDRVGGLPIDDEFRQGLRRFLEGFRLAGHDIEIEAPRYISLEIAMTVQVAPDYFRSAVKKVLLDTLGSGLLPSGQLAFFHPDRFSFGQSVYLSPVVAAAMQTAGVRNVNVTRFQRQGEADDRSLETGQISCDRLEILRLDNRPDTPENGRLILNLTGGL
ncbi:putative baseplate assembly protein [Leptolyngbya ohadii]|uniref:putative baseplate assembly protein n=1 Tax=Leptolyngbya ohadii TaxID=1962290 RepID=UPI001CED495B|nr:putative baseplate assembly protein [Leptolyngbya ohadii]